MTATAGRKCLILHGWSISCSDFIGRAWEHYWFVHHGPCFVQLSVHFQIHVRGLCGSYLRVYLAKKRGSTRSSDRPSSFLKIWRREEYRRIFSHTIYFYLRELGVGGTAMSTFLNDFFEQQLRRFKGTRRLGVNKKKGDKEYIALYSLLSPYSHLHQK